MSPLRGCLLTLLTIQVISKVTSFNMIDLSSSFLNSLSCFPTEAEQSEEQLYQEISKVGIIKSIDLMFELNFVFGSRYILCLYIILQANVICIVYSVNNKKSIEKVIICNPKLS